MPLVELRVRTGEELGRGQEQAVGIGVIASSPERCSWVVCQV